MKAGEDKVENPNKDVIFGTFWTMLVDVPC